MSALKDKLKNPGLLATLVFVIGCPVGIWATRLPQWTGFGLRTWAVPLAAGLGAMAVVLFLAWREQRRAGTPAAATPSGKGVIASEADEPLPDSRAAKATATIAGSPGGESGRAGWRSGDWVAGLAGGAFAVWISMILTAALRGTPFPFNGLIGDAGRLAAMATRYSTTWASSDTLLPGVPAEYPPMFPWSIGRVAALTGQEAWQLVGQAEAIYTGLALLIGFVLWQRLVKPWTALAVTVIGFMAFAIAAKSYELLTLMAFVPWVLGTFGRPERGRLHWLVSGLIGGLIVLTYYGWVIFGIFGILALLGRSWFLAEDRKAYLLYLAKVAGVAFVVSSWFIVPFFVARQQYGGPTLGDLYGTASILDQMFPFLDFTLLGTLQLIGLIGLIWLRGKQWWASPLLALVVGAYLYRAVTAVMFVLTDHTMLGQYAPRLYTTVLVMAGVLTVIHFVPWLIAKLDVKAPAYAGLIALTVAVAFSGFTFTKNWMPKLGGVYASYTERAYLEPLPDGRYLVDTTGENPTPWFPVKPIENAVERVYGADPQRVVLTADERLFSYLPWPGYLGTDLGGALANTFERHAELDKLAATTDPVAFSQVSASTRYGPIDIFVLKKKDGLWTWTTHMGYSKAPKTVSFSPAQFDPKLWAVTDLPEDYVVAVRL